eukprot:1151315-Pelagomonas_calceolata.AAC.6
MGVQAGAGCDIAFRPYCSIPSGFWLRVPAKYDQRHAFQMGLITDLVEVNVSYPQWTSECFLVPHQHAHPVPPGKI